MAATNVEADGDAVIAPTKAKGGRKKLLILATPLLLGGIGAGLWFTGVLPRALGLTHAKEAVSAEASAAANKPVYVEMPEMVANLNAGPRRQSYIKLKAQVEIGRPEDVAAFNAAMPRIVDLFQTYLREMAPDDLRGAIGTYRLREELIARAGIAASPAHVVDVLFSELLIQ